MSWENLDALYRSKVSLVTFVLIVALKLLLIPSFVLVSQYNDDVAMVFFEDHFGFFIVYFLGSLLSRVFSDMSATVFWTLYCVIVYIPCFFILSKNIKIKCFSVTWFMVICIIDLVLRLVVIASVLVIGGNVGWKSVFLLMNIAVLTFTIIYRRAIRQSISLF